MSASMCSGMPGRQGLEAQLARDLLDDAALLRPGRLADELHRDARLDRLVEAHLVEVDVRQRAADRMLLVLLEDGVMRRLLPLDHDVEDRVEPRPAGEGRSQIALLDEDRAGVTTAVDDAGDQPLLPEAAHVARADLVGIAGGDLEGDAVARHRRRMVAEGRL